MAISGKVLAEGQLSNSKATLYTVPAGVTAYIKYMHVYNTSGAETQNIFIYVKPGSASRVIARIVLTPNMAADVIDKDAALILEEGDTIEGETTSITTVDYVITGAEE